MTGALEPTNDAYAIAKIAGIKLCQAYAAEYGENFISAMPTNLYGPNDNFDLASSHVLPALLRKAHEAKLQGAHELVVWGTGQPRREFLYVDDMADACVFLLAELRFARDRQCRLRRRHLHPRAGRTDLRGHWFRRQSGFRRQQTGRHAAQTARRFEIERTRLAAEDFLAGRNRAHLRVVLRTIPESSPRAPHSPHHEQTSRWRRRGRAHRQKPRSAVRGAIGRGVHRALRYRYRESRSSWRRISAFTRPLR